MIVCNKFVFLHLHKSGGTFVNQMISSCIPYARQIGYHLPYSEIPKSFNRLAVIGSVRNPWSYYVSWYHFQYKLKNSNPLFMWVSENKTLGFEKTINNLISIGQNEGDYEYFKSLLPEKFDNNGINLTQSCISPVFQHTSGFYSFLYDRLYKGTSEPSIMKMENLRAELTELIISKDVQPKQRIVDFLQNTPMLNVSKHEEYQSYYSDKLRNTIANLDANIIDKYKYTF